MTYILENSFISEQDPDTAFELKELTFHLNFNPAIPSTLEHMIFSQTEFQAIPQTWKEKHIFGTIQGND